MPVTGTGYGFNFFNWHAQPPSGARRLARSKMLISSATASVGWRKLSQKRPTITSRRTMMPSDELGFQWAVGLGIAIRDGSRRACSLALCRRWGKQQTAGAGRRHRTSVTWRCDILMENASALSHGGGVRVSLPTAASLRPSAAWSQTGRGCSSRKRNLPARRPRGRQNFSCARLRARRPLRPNLGCHFSDLHPREFILW
jgi:hypothetical protein